MDYYKTALSLSESLIDLRREIHQNPEIGFELPKTRALILKELGSTSFKVKDTVGKAGIVADLIVHEKAPFLAFRADMDALPIQERSEKHYKSKVADRAHLCGHDVHTSILLGLAQALNENAENLKNNIRLIFQPNEEKYPGGARFMIQEGVLNKVQKIFAFHVWPSIDVGNVGICPGSAFAQPDLFDVELVGKGGHAAFPHLANDPINGVVQVCSSLMQTINRKISPFAQSVLSITKLHGGVKHNVIPESASFGGTIRNLDRSTQVSIKSEFHKIVKSTSEMLNLSERITYREGYPILKNNLDVCDEINALSTELFGAEKVEFPSEPSLAAEDFSYYLEHVSGCLIFLGCRNEEEGIVHALHHPSFDVHEKCISVGLALFLKIAFESRINPS